MAQPIVQNAVDIVRVDVLWRRGITGTLEITCMADVFGLNCEMYTTIINYMDLVSLYVSCAICNCRCLEHFISEDSFRFPMKGDLPVKGGRIYAFKELGIGTELDWDLIKNNCVARRVKILDQDFVE